MSHFARFDSLVEFDARSLPLGLAIFNYDFVINDKVTNFRPRTLAGAQNRWGVEDIVRYLDDLLIVTADRPRGASSWGLYFRMFAMVCAC